MLPFVVISIIVLVSILLLHYLRHFKFRVRCINPESTRTFSAADVDSSGSEDTSGWTGGFMRRKSSTKPRTSTVTDFFKDAKSYRCMFTSSSDQEFDFFPITFVFYLSFLIIVCIIIVIRCIILNTYIELHMPYAIPTMDLSFPSNNTIHMTHITDWILVYCIPIISLWESLFSFYRFYLTYSTSKSLTAQPTMLRVFLIFSMYMITYSAFYVAFIHYNYWFFPFIILIHFSFNTFCTFQFAAILIKSCQSFISMETSQQNININQQILYSVYFMRKTSFFCTVIQSLYLSIFCIFYSINIVYYIPILWSISALVFTLNFVRNREFLTASMYKYNQLCCCCIFLHQTATRPRTRGSKSKSTRKTSNDTKLVTHDPKPEKPTKTAETRATDERFKMRGLKIDINKNELMTPTSPSRGRVSSPSVPSQLARESIVPLPIKHPHMQRSQSAFDLKPMRVLKSKALDLLGLHQPLQPFTIAVDRLKIESDEEDEEEMEMDRMDMEFEATMISINRPTPRPTPNQTPVSTQLDVSRLDVSMYDVSQAQYSLNIPAPVHEDEAAEVSFDVVVTGQEEEIKHEAVANLDQLNLNEVARSLNLLVNHGFCSQQTVNNVKEISRYIHKRQHY
eukprot:243669_1